MTTNGGSPVRMTRQRRAVEAALEAASGFCSAQDLHAEMRSAGDRVALATVYTQLRSMAERSEVDVIRSEGGEALYRRCGAGEHHHHLRCRSCGHVEELHAPTVEDWANEVARSSGYTDLAHTLDVTGLCPRCAYA